MAQEQLTKKRLIYSILKFLDKEIQTETANAERRESIEGRQSSSRSKGFDFVFLS